ncbi:MAG: hypothetical protein FWF29_10875 [Treponema sp.]|nr:hypothetical protein [Treponema sp.]
MKRYCIKSRAGKIEYFDIIAENEDEYRISLTRISDGNERIIEETMPRHLFNMCLKTGYIFEINNTSATVA